MAIDRARCARLREALMELLEVHSDAEDEEIRAMIDELVLTDAEKPRLTVNERLLIGRELFYSVRRLDILQDLIDDKSVTEIMVNGPDSIYVEQNGRIRRWNRTFTSREKLEDVIQQIVGKCNRVVNEQNPIVDARLMDGSRVNAVISPVALDGPILTIRQFPEDPITMERLIRSGSISAEAAQVLTTLVAAGYSMIIGGGTSAGKTTFLNALSNATPGEERIITI
jgi:pilus assembly protein CpaF